MTPCAFCLLLLGAQRTEPWGVGKQNVVKEPFGEEDKLKSLMTPARRQDPCRELTTAKFKRQCRKRINKDNQTGEDVSGLILKGEGRRDKKKEAQDEQFFLLHFFFSRNSQVKH